MGGRGDDVRPDTCTCMYVHTYTHSTHKIDQPAHLALAVLLVGVVGVEKREVVPVHVRKLRLGCVRACLFLFVEVGGW